MVEINSGKLFYELVAVGLNINSVNSKGIIHWTDDPKTEDVILSKQIIADHGR